MDRLRSELDEVTAQAVTMTEAEGFTPEDPGYVGLKERAAQLQKSYGELADWQNRKAAADEIGATLHRADLRRRAAEDERNKPAPPPSELTLGELFVRSAEFNGYQGRGASSRFEAPETLMTRAPITTLTPPGSLFVVPDFHFAKRPPSYQTPWIDLAQPVQVSSGVVEWVDYPAAAPLAAVVPETTLKPEAVLTASTVSKTLDTVAHHVICTRQVLEDAPQIRSWIDGNLVRGVGDKLEALAAAALTGATLPTATGASLEEAIRAGIATVQTAGYQPNAIAISPADAAAIDIAMMQGTLNGAVVNGSLWGVRMVVVGAIPDGSPIVGDFTSGLTFFYRTGTQVFITDSHSDFFLRNQFVILAERRALSAVTTPEALAEVSVGAPLAARGGTGGGGGGPTAEPRRTPGR